MPSGSFRQVDVQCPFYQNDDGKQRILCEGVFPRSTLRITFRENDDFVKHIETCCCNRYTKCPVYLMLWDKWEEEGNAVDPG